MVKMSYSILAVVVTAALSSFISYDNGFGVAFTLTQFQIVAGIIG